VTLSTSNPATAATTIPAPSKWIPWLLGLPPLILVGVYVVVRRVSGPFFLSANFDPDYAYLFNGLNIALSRAPMHTDHPGTPLQLLGAVWIRLHNLGASTEVTVTNTILNSEDRLAQLNMMIFFLLLCAVAAAGLFIHRRKQKTLSAFLPAAGLLFMGTNVYCLGRFNPEPFLLLDSFLLGLSIYGYFGVDKIMRPQPLARITPSLAFPLLAAFLVATGLAIKIDSAPLVLLPLFLIPNSRGKLAYVFFSLVVLALWLIPDYGQLARMEGWWEGLATSTGRYGTGSAGLLDAHTYFRNVASLAVINLPYFLLITGSLLLAIHGLLHQRNEPGSDYPRSVFSTPAGVLLAVSGCELLQFLVASKYQLSRYLVPGMGLAGLDLLLLLDSGSFTFAQRWLRPVVAVLGLAGAVIAARSLVQLDQRTTENLKVFDAGQNFPGQPTRIYGYGSSSPYYAWYFGNNFSGWAYGSALYLLVPHSDHVFFYDNFLKYCVDVRGHGIPSEYFTTHGPVIFQSPPLGGDDPIYNWPKGLKLTEKFGGQYEKIYGLDAVMVRSDATHQ